MANRKKNSRPSTDNEHKFIPKDDDDQTLWEALEITDEDDEAFRIRWAGLNPKTKRPWPLQWVLKEDVTDDLVKAWRQVKPKRRRSASTAKVSTSSNRSASGRVSMVHKTHKSPIKRQPAPSQRTGQAHPGLSSSPGTVIIPAAAKRKRDASEPTAQEEDTGLAVHKRRKIHLLNQRSQVASLPSLLPQHEVPVEAAQNEKHDPNIIDLPLPEPDLLPEPSSMLDFWANPFAPGDTVIGNSSRDTVVSESQPRGDSPSLDSSPAGPPQTRAEPAPSVTSKPLKPRQTAPHNSLEKALGSLPHLSPSVFHPYLDQPLSPIEQFDSPVKSPKPAQNLTGARQAPNSKAPPDTDLIIAERLEDELLDWTGGITPDLQDTAHQLQELTAVVQKLRDHVADYEKKTTDLIAARDARDIENAQLREELTALRTELDITHKAADDQKRTFEEQLRELQKGAEQWKELYDTERTKDRPVDDDIQRKAAEHPELKAEITASKARISELEAQLIELQNEKSSLRKTVAGILVGDEDHDENPDALTAKTIWLEARVKGLLERLEHLESEKSGRAEREEGPAEETQNKHLHGEVDDEREEFSMESQAFPVNAWACIHRFAPGDECLESFSSRAALRDHYMAVHVPE
ncbi:uncharacterized protein PHACADRAFT_195835 [Phanerochaete carnosa HHB-10118-sp]|uniref:C2H2-type domain-containing protein n=1 Tax=Phanerochaete carnosa (strain HHB-10118-sp) TaxID=650164 RepID=K5WZ52_PHACS|nr:uncharacterized protein PHACADRAFT_195835 [Phanerochaete carnosa HHB-10118-sp]EKM55782.1 hypothetical protein PHACADRAFT_195835 [Phanerochaete carnosa HHB-10118-sp]